MRTSDGKTVTEIFPEFRPGKVLRFSRLFGPKKYVSAQWRGLRKKKKKKKMTSLDGDNIPIQRGFRSKTPPLPRPEDCASDDEVSTSCRLSILAWLIFSKCLSRKIFALLDRPEEAKTHSLACASVSVS